MIEIKINAADIAKAIEQLTSAGANTAPLMHELAGIMHNAVEENFEQGGRPKWPKWTNATEEKRAGGKMLQDTGRLAASITPYADANSAMVGTNVIYASIHNFGGQTKAHKIVAKNGKHLKFGGTYRKSVNHPGSKIPQREFLRLEISDEEDLLDAVGDDLRKALS